MKRQPRLLGYHLSIFEQRFANTFIFAPLGNNEKAEIDQKFGVGVIVDRPLQEQIADNALACEGGEKNEPIGVIVGAVKLFHDLDAVHRSDRLLFPLKQTNAMQLD